MGPGAIAAGARGEPRSSLGPVDLARSVNTGRGADTPRRPSRRKRPAGVVENGPDAERDRRPRRERGTDGRNRDRPATSADGAVAGRHASFLGDREPHVVRAWPNGRPSGRNAASAYGSARPARKLLVRTPRRPRPARRPGRSITHTRRSLFTPIRLQQASVEIRDDRLRRLAAERGCGPNLYRTSFVSLGD